MTISTISDLSRSFQLRQANARLTADLARLSGEAASGRVADLRAEEQGDMRPLAAIERNLALLERQGAAASEAALLAGTAQSALASIAADTEALVSTLFLARSAAQPAQIDAVGAAASDAFEGTVARLNVQVAGRSVFAGLASDGPALAPAGDMLAALETAATGAVTAADVEAAVAAWFAPGGGFDTAGYLGSAEAIGPIRLADGAAASFDVTAEDSRIREALSGMAMAALLDRGALAGEPEERAELAERAAQALLPARDGMVSLQAEVGEAEASIERASVRITAEISASEIARGGILNADPFESAAALMAVETQLEALYAVTARLSRLTLAEYLR